MYGDRFQAKTKDQRDDGALPPTIVQTEQGRFEPHERLMMIGHVPQGLPNTVQQVGASCCSLHLIRTIILAGSNAECGALSEP
jgi:hypothetical protein